MTRRFVSGPMCFLAFFRAVAFFSTTTAQMLPNVYTILVRTQAVNLVWSHRLLCLAIHSFDLKRSNCRKKSKPFNFTVRTNCKIDKFTIGILGKPFREKGNLVFVVEKKTFFGRIFMNVEQILIRSMQLHKTAFVQANQTKEDDAHVCN